MLEGLCVTLADSSSKAASSACYAIHNFAGACEGEKENDTNVLSKFMPYLIDKLLATTSRSDWEENSIRSAAYEALNVMVANSAKDMLTIVKQLMLEALSRLEKTFSPQFNVAERMNLQVGFVFDWICHNV